ncbi:MAG: SRPBCC family protein [bacterium]
METRNNTSYELSRVFQVTPATLFNAFIDAGTLKHIWGISSISVDARPSGQTRAEMSLDNENWNFTITYQEVIPHEKLRWIVHFDRFPSKETRVTLLFKATAGGAEVTVRMENFETPEERDGNKQAWEGALKKLERLL